MRKLIFGAFLLGTTALWPVQAHAMPPVLGFIGGLVTALGATGVGGAIVGLGGVGAIGGFAAGYGFAGSLLGGLLIKGALSLGLSYLSSLLRPRPQAPNPGAKMVNIRQPISFMEFGYGRVRKGGIVNFWKVKDGKRYYNVIFAAHECDGVEVHYADEREVELDVDGFITNVEYDAGGVSRVQIVDYLGAPGQISPPLLNTNFTQWTDDHNMDGLCHAVAVAQNTSAEDFSEIYPTGREPVITELLRMKKVLDPRTGLTEWTTNAALIMADWIVSPDGLNREVDWEQVEIEADICDSVVTDRAGNPLPKWQLSGTYSAAEDRESTRAQMGVACDAFFYEDTNGVVGFNVGRYIEPEVEINDDHILTIQYSEGQPGTDVVNSFSVQYTEPEQGYREAASAPYIIDDPLEAYEEDSLQVFWIGNHNQAVRVSKRLLLNSRSKYRISATLKYHGIRLLKQRTFRLNHVEMGVDMTFEVDKLVRNDDGLTWSVEAHSITEEDFDFNAPVEEPEKPKRTAFETTSDVPEPTGITAISEPFAGSVSIFVDFDDPPRDSLLNQIRYRVKTPAGDWFQTSVPPKQSYQRIVGLDDGETYQVQVRAINSVGRASKWVPNSGGDENIPTLEVTTIVNPVAPGALTGVSATGGLGKVDLAYTTSSNLNLNRVGVYRAPTGVPLDRAAHLVAEIAAIQSTTYAKVDGDNTRTNLLLTPDFATDTNWTKGTGWTISVGQAHHAAGSTGALTQNVALTLSATYRLAYTITSISAGDIRSRLQAGGNISDGAIHTTTGTKLDTLVMPASGSPTSFNLRASATAAASIDNAVIYLQTGACAPQGVWDYYLEELNISGIHGTTSGPHTVTVI